MSGHLRRYERGLLPCSDAWVRRWFVLYDNSTLVWYRESNDLQVKGTITLREAPEFVAASRWTNRVPGRPVLPHSYDVKQLIAVGQLLKRWPLPPSQRVHWLLAPTKADCRNWMTAISATLPNHSQPTPKLRFHGGWFHRLCPEIWRRAPLPPEVVEERRRGARGGGGRDDEPSATRADWRGWGRGEGWLLPTCTCESSESSADPHPPSPPDERRSRSPFAAATKASQSTVRGAVDKFAAEVGMESCKETAENVMSSVTLRLEELSDISCDLGAFM